MSTDDEDSSLPKSMRHKQILDAATEHPDASIEELSSMVPSATAELVKRVLDEHGDPADGETNEETANDTHDLSQKSTDAANGSTNDGGNDDSQPSEDMTAENAGDTNEATEQFPERDTLSQKQREVLEAIADRPESTQRELGEYLEISGPTVSNRVNSIEGFEWKHRQAFVDAVLDNESNTMSTEEKTTQTDLAETLAQVDERLSTLESTLEDDTTEPSQQPADSTFEEPQLAHKVIHACMEADHITEEEELQIIEEIIE